MDSGGNAATKVGRNWRYMASACRRAFTTAAWSDRGRIGNRSAIDSSSAIVRDATSRKARARRLGFSCAVAKNATTITRISTNAGSGEGKSAAAEGFDIRSLITVPHTDRSPSDSDARSPTFNQGANYHLIHFEYLPVGKLGLCVGYRTRRERGLMAASHGGVAT